MIPNGGTFGGLHTYNDLNMIPKSKIIFNPPEVHENYFDLQNTNGELDFTGVLTGGVTYGNRKGTLYFIVLTGSDYQAAYSAALQHFNGKEMTVILDDAVNYYYKGRFTVNAWKSWEGHSEIAIDYDVEPSRYRVT